MVGHDAEGVAAIKTEHDALLVGHGSDLLHIEQLSTLIEDCREQHKRDLQPVWIGFNKHNCACAYSMHALVRATQGAHLIVKRRDHVFLVNGVPILALDQNQVLVRVSALEPDLSAQRIEIRRKVEDIGHDFATLAL